MSSNTTTREGETFQLSRVTVILPEIEQDRLRKVRESRDLAALRQLVLAYRRARWPLRAIGDPLGAPRSTVRMWEKGADSSANIPTVPECERAERGRGERTARLRMDVPPDDRDELRRLAESARQVRGRTPRDAQPRIDADILDRRIEKYIKRNVPVKRIAQHMGVTPRAVAARYERYLERRDRMKS